MISRDHIAVAYTGGEFCYGNVYEVHVNILMTPTHSHAYAQYSSMGSMEPIHPPLHWMVSEVVC